MEHLFEFKGAYTCEWEGKKKKKSVFFCCISVLSTSTLHSLLLDSFKRAVSMWYQLVLVHSTDNLQDRVTSGISCGIQKHIQAFH